MLGHSSWQGDAQFVSREARASHSWQELSKGVSHQLSS